MLLFFRNNRHMVLATSNNKIVETLYRKIGFPCKNALLKTNGELKYISVLTPPPLPLSMLLLVSLNVITKSITILIEGGLIRGHVY